MSIKDETKELIVFVLIMLSVASIFSYVLFGITGVRVAAGIIFLSLPFYIFFNNFELSIAEKSVFSILLGLTIFPSLVYILGLVISFRIAIIVAFISFLGIAVIATKYKSKKQI